MRIRTMCSVMLALTLASAGACTAYVRPDGAVYIHRAPPPLRVEVRGTAPSGAHVWVAGRWDWRGDDFVWVPGGWVLPESGRHQWVAGAWHHDSGGWFWVDGHWR